MQNHTQTRNTLQTAAEAKPEQRQEALRLQAIDVLDLQQAIVANQLIPITHRSEPKNGIPFSALND
jgi:hypothetical protein